MKFYKETDLRRLAGEMICKDFAENPKFAFTNTSYGGRGGETVICTIKSLDERPVESEIQYSLIEDWPTGETKLMKNWYTTYYKVEKDGVVIQEYKKEENHETILTLYRVALDRIYVDDKDYADAARKIRWERYRNGKPVISEDGSLFGTRTLEPNTVIYDKYFAVASRGRQLKYGTNLSLHIYKQKGYRYEADWKDRTETMEIVAGMNYVYRGRSYNKFLRKTVYDIA